MGCWCNCCYLSIIWLCSATSSPCDMKNWKTGKTKCKKTENVDFVTAIYSLWMLAKEQELHVFTVFIHTPSLPSPSPKQNKQQKTRTDRHLVTFNTETFCPMMRSIISSLSYDLNLSQFPIMCEWYSSTDYDNTLKKMHLMVRMVLYAYLTSLSHYHDTFTLGCVFTIFPHQ